MIFLYITGKNKEENVENEKSPKPNEKGVTKEKESSKNVPELKSSRRRRKRKVVSLIRKKKLDENQDSESQKNPIKRSKRRK
uniref:Uncharacterized protein n=1 Tax=Lactuca sativa TaxID=4236 RepID=A0A9R1WKF6_LACSA|nr:hypothetical protein LSAT_V11C100036700 [Lactuca sativa]